MPDTRIILSGLWVATMLTYLLGDVLRILSGDFQDEEIGGMQLTQGMWMLIGVAPKNRTPHQSSRNL